MTDPLAGVSAWPTPAAAGWVAPGAEAIVGPADRTFPWASVTKLLTSLAMWVAVEEGTVAWEDPVGPPGSTLAHLLAHASGLAPDDEKVIAPPGTRRIYSNAGFEVAAGYLAARAEMPFADYVTAGVTEPLGMRSTDVSGSPASGASGPIGDLLLLAKELVRPTLVSPATHAAATSVAFPGLAGVLPGYGWQEHNDWGLGVEIRDHKQPHWTGRLNSASTFGHFGRSGSFLWVDPVAGLALASVAELAFGRWAVSAWPELSDEVLRDKASR
jgi:CubicO group peptidase (beta-lactamase class C family)